MISLQKHKHAITHALLDKAFKGTFVNRGLLSLQGGSCENFRITRVS